MVLGLGLLGFGLGLGVLAVVFLRVLVVVERGQREGWRAVREAQVAGAEAVSGAVEAAASSVGSAVAEALGPGRRDQPGPGRDEERVVGDGGWGEDWSDGWENVTRMTGGAGVAWGSYDEDGGGPDEPPGVA